MHVLRTLSWVSLGLATASAVVIALDLGSRRQKMWIMNLVWPLTALWAGPLGLWAYFRYGRVSGPAQRARESNGARGEKQPFSIQAAKGTTHCGSGCVLGDISAEVLSIALPLSLFGHKMFGTWTYALVSAFAIGIAFQYFTIKPMRHLSSAEGLKEALKADTLSLLAWQLGMFGWMALATFVIFHHELAKSNPTFWLMMQIAMCCGFVTSYPVNRWLLRRGIKEAM